MGAPLRQQALSTSENYYTIEYTSLECSKLSPINIPQNPRTYYEYSLVR